jgi:hypothetical protein
MQECAAASEAVSSEAARLGAPAIKKQLAQAGAVVEGLHEARAVAESFDHSAWLAEQHRKDPVGTVEYLRGFPNRPRLIGVPRRVPCGGRRRSGGARRTRRTSSRSDNSGGESSDSKAPGERPRHDVVLLRRSTRLQLDSLARIVGVLS